MQGALLLIGVSLILLFIELHFILPLDILSTIIDNFNKISIGIAAIITAYFGSSYLRDELARKAAIKFYTRKYPPDKYKQTFKIIESEDDRGAIYLFDMESLLKHHIWNMKTVYDLGWQTYAREALPKEEFLSYLSGNPIRTRGDLGE